MLWTIPIVYFLFVSAEFLAVTHIALTLTGRGLSAFEVGVFGSALWIGIFAVSTLAHVVVDRVGHARTLAAGSALAATALASLALHDRYVGWVLGAALLGAGGGLVWVAGESWLAEVAPAERRGFYVGLFETSVGLAMVAGPAMVPLALALGTDALRMAVALMLGALAGSALLWSQPGPSARAAADSGHDGSVEAIASAAAAAAAAWRATVLPLAALAAVSGLMESGASTMLPPLSMRLGFSVTAAASLGAVIGAGSALLQAPFGSLADRVGMPRAMALAWCTVLVATLVLWFGSGSPRTVLWGVGFALGGMGGAVYTLSVVELGHRLGGTALVRAMGLLVTAYTAGTSLGPMAGGWLFDRDGLAGLAAGLFVLALAGTVAARRAVGAPPRRMNQGSAAAADPHATTAQEPGLDRGR